MNFLFLVDRTLLKMSLAVVRSDVYLVTSPGKLIIFPPKLSRVRFVSAFCGHISATIFSCVTVLPAGNFSFGINNIMLVPDGILVPTPCASRPVSFANNFSQMDFVGPLIRFLYSRDTPVVG